jgi:hypothetical protein
VNDAELNTLIDLTTGYIQSGYKEFGIVSLGLITSVADLVVTLRVKQDKEFMEILRHHEIVICSKGDT